MAVLEIFDDRRPVFREIDERRPSVGRVSLARDEARGDKAVDEAGDRPRRHLQGVREYALVRRAMPAQLPQEGGSREMVRPSCARARVMSSLTTTTSASTRSSAVPKSSSLTHYEESTPSDRIRLSAHRRTVSAVSASAGATMRAGPRRGAPRSRALPALGTRLGSHPRLARAVLAVPQRLPVRPLRAAAVSHVATPLVHGMDARLEVAVVGGSRMWVDTSDVTGRMLATSGVWEPTSPPSSAASSGPATSPSTSVRTSATSRCSARASSAATAASTRSSRPRGLREARCQPRAERRAERPARARRRRRDERGGDASGRRRGEQPGRVVAAERSRARMGRPQGRFGIRAAAHARGGRHGVGLAAAAPREGRRRGLRVRRPRGPRADPRRRDTGRRSPSSSTATSTRTRATSSWTSRDATASPSAGRRPAGTRSAAGPRTTRASTQYDEPGLLTAVDDPRVDVLLTPRAARYGSVSEA